MRRSSSWLCAFFSAATGTTTTTTNAWKPAFGGRRLDATLLQRADAVREKRIAQPPPLPTEDDLLTFPSIYTKPEGSGIRGFCNWLIPQRIMIGQYPGQNPEPNGPSTEEVEEHLRSLVQDAGINLFCSLQSEIPSQNDSIAWEKANGQVYLPEYLRSDFPKPFTHYAPLVQSLSSDNNTRDIPPPQFLHAPIEDLNVPNSKPLQNLLSTLLQAIEEEDRVIYLHCWGGRGRAGLVGACLTSLLWPDLDSTAVLDLVQAGYDTRAGAADMPLALSRSPQTEQQRLFVQQFVNDHRRQRRRQQ